MDGGPQDGRGCSGERDSDRHPQQRWPDKVLREACQRRIRPERQLACRFQEHEEERPDGGHRRREDDGQQASAPQGLHARGRQFVGAARQRLAAADDGQRQSEAEQEGEGCVERPPSADRGDRWGHADGRPQDVSTHERGHAPNHRDHEHGHADPDRPRHGIASDITAHAGCEPQHAEDADRAPGLRDPPAGPNR